MRGGTHVCVMYTEGHLEILQEALNSENCKSSCTNSSFTASQLRSIKEGLKYPDFPCGKYAFDPSDPKRVVFDARICSLFNVIADLSIAPNYFASSFASHNGYFSVWHSMTYDPDRTVQQISRDVMDQIIAFLSLAFCDENTGRVRPQPRLFWLGMALHVIMDSYSPAHTLRLPAHSSASGSAAVEVSTGEYSALVERVRAHPATQTAAVRKSNAVLRELKDALMAVAERVDADDAQQIDAVLAALFAKHHIRDKTRRKDLSKMAMFLYFHNHHQIRIKRQITDLNISAAPKPRDQIGRGLRNAIVTFFSYPQQSAWFHKVNDLMLTVRSKNLAEPAVQDCAQILQMTRKLCDLYRAAKTARSVSKVGPQQKQKPSRKDVTTYLKRVYVFLQKATFKLTPGVSQMRTGVAESFYAT